MNHKEHSFNEPKDRYHVFWWDDLGFQARETPVRVDVELAAETAKMVIDCGGAERVIITDPGDHTCFEWKRELGITWPPLEGTS